MTASDQSHPAGKPDYTTLRFPDPPPDRPYVIINMVSSLDGKVTVEGTERGLGSPADQRLMRELRVNADVVLNGAGTLRASGTSSRLDVAELERIRVDRGLAPQPIAAVLSRSGNLPLERRFFTALDDFDAVLYLSTDAPAASREALVATGRLVVDVPAEAELPAMLRHMRQELAARLLLVEGGPRINGALFDLGAVDELFLTLGPIVVSGRGGLTAVEADATARLDGIRRMELIHAIPNPETSEVYLRYRTQRQA
jgi:riboflavin biosynthesis pyrimidine reductase